MITIKNMIKIVWIILLSAIAIYIINWEPVSSVGHQGYFIADSIILRSIAEISNYSKGLSNSIGGLTITGDFTKGKGLQNIENVVNDKNIKNYYFMLGMHFYSGRNKFQIQDENKNIGLSKIDLFICNKLYPDIFGDLSFDVGQRESISWIKEYCFIKELNELEIDERLTVMSRIISSAKQKSDLINKFPFLSSYFENEYLNTRDNVHEIDSLYDFSQYSFWLWNNQDGKFKKDLLNDWPFLKEVEQINNSNSLDELKMKLSNLKTKIEFDENMFRSNLFKILKKDFEINKGKNFYEYVNQRLRLFSIINSRRFDHLKLSNENYLLDNNKLSLEDSIEIENQFIIPFYKKIIDRILRKNPQAKIVVFQYPGIEIINLKKALGNFPIEIVSVDEWLNLKNKKYYEKFIDNISNSGHFTKELSHEFSQNFIKKYL